MTNKEIQEDLVALEATYNFTNTEYTDELTNKIMDYLRDKLSINSQSDIDDIIYSQIWFTISMHNHRIKSNLNK